MLTLDEAESRIKAIEERLAAEAKAAETKARQGLHERIQAVEDGLHDQVEAVAAAIKERLAKVENAVVATTGDLADAVARHADGVRAHVSAELHSWRGAVALLAFGMVTGAGGLALAQRFWL